MSYLPQEIREKAKKLRTRGFSLREISSRFRISKSTASIWSKDIILSNTAMRRLEKRKMLGQYKTILLRKKRRENKQKILLKQSQKIFNNFTLNKDRAKIICALIYYCEGVKGVDTLVTFINSDPTLISIFLFLFRKAFIIDEKKFRVLMHLHEYHKESIQKNFWSKITKIPENQFYKTYWKQNEGKRIRKDYQGCVSIRYYNDIIAKELLAIYRVAVVRLIH